MLPTLKEESIEQEAAEQLTAALREIPFLSTAAIRRASTRGDARIDFILAIRSAARRSAAGRSAAGRSAANDRRLVCRAE